MKIDGEWDSVLMAKDRSGVSNNYVVGLLSSCCHTDRDSLIIARENFIVCCQCTVMYTTEFQSGGGGGQGVLCPPPPPPPPPPSLAHH